LLNYRGPNSADFFFIAQGTEFLKEPANRKSTKSVFWYPRQPVKRLMGPNACKGANWKAAEFKFSQSDVSWV